MECWYYIHTYASKKGHARKDGQQAWANARQILRILGLKTPAKSSLQKTAYLLDYLVQKEFLTSHYRYYRPLLPAFATFNLLNLFCHWFLTACFVQGSKIYRREILTFQLERQKLFCFAHITWSKRLYVRWQISLILGLKTRARLSWAKKNVHQWL